jgi:hypothetical protein
MLFFSKIHTLVTIVLTMGTSVWLDQSAPYFPIEISRTATGHLSQPLFVFGMATLPVSLYADNAIAFSLPFSAIYVWMGIMGVACFSDTHYLIIHTMGVLWITIMVIGHTLWYGDIQQRLGVLACACLLEGVRGLIKACIIMWAELDWCWYSWKTYYHLLMYRSKRAEVLNRILTVMHFADGTEYTMFVMKVTAILQWMAFFVMSWLY